MGLPGHRTEMDNEWPEGLDLPMLQHAPIFLVLVDICWSILKRVLGRYKRIYNKLSSCCHAARYLECEEILLDRVVEAAQGMASEISYSRLGGFVFALVGSSLVKFQS